MAVQAVSQHGGSYGRPLAPRTTSDSRTRMSDAGILSAGDTNRRNRRPRVVACQQCRQAKVSLPSRTEGLFSVVVVNLNGLSYDARDPTAAFDLATDVRNSPPSVWSTLSTSASVRERTFLTGALLVSILYANRADDSPLRTLSDIATQVQLLRAAHTDDTAAHRLNQGDVPIVPSSHIPDNRYPGAAAALNAPSSPHVNSSWNAGSSEDYAADSNGDATLRRPQPPTSAADMASAFPASREQSIRSVTVTPSEIQHLFQV